MAEVTTPDAENIFKLLQSTRRNSDNAVELVNKLEGRSDVGLERNSQFYQAYVTKLIQMYCDDYSEEIKSSLEDVYDISVQPENIAHGTSEDRIEFMLAGYGILYGYDSIKNQYERIKKYYSQAKTTSTVFRSKEWDQSSLKSKSSYFLTNLDRELAIKLEKELEEANSTGKLGLYNKIDMDSFELPRSRFQNQDRLLPKYMKRILSWFSERKYRILITVVALGALVVFGILFFFSKMQKQPFPEQIQDYPMQIPTEHIEENRNNVKVDSITAKERTQPVIYLFPGSYTTVTVEIQPENADRRASCSGYNPEALYVDYTAETGEIFIRAEEKYNLKASGEQEIITVTPRSKASPDVHAEFTVSIEKPPIDGQTSQTEEQDERSIMFPKTQ